MRAMTDELMRDDRTDYPSGVDPLAEAVYRAYRHPVGRLTRRSRVTVLTGAAEAEVLEHYRRKAAIVLRGPDIGAAVLDLLVVDGRRVGEVIYDRLPRPADYVLVATPDSYRLVLPNRGRLCLSRQEPDVRAA